MRKVILFNLITLDGYFEGPNHDISWHNVDDEFNKFAATQMQQTGAILFGKRTYELMRDFWPSYIPEDKENTIVRDQMDMLPKYVYSTTLDKVEEHENWKNVTLHREVTAKEITKLKQQTGNDIMMLGSGILANAFMQLGLFDEIRVMVNPVLLGKGTPMFKTNNKLDLKLLQTQTFGNGNILLTYQPTK